MVMPTCGGVPAPMFGGTVGLPEVETLAMMAPTAPAFCAFFTFRSKLQAPRSMKAIFPATAGPMAVHPSAGLARTRPTTPVLNFRAPKAAVPTWVFAAGRGGGPV